MLTVQDGSIAAPDGRTTSYWELADDRRLDRPATGLAEPKAAADYRIVGTSVPRVDLPDKLAPRPRFLHDMALDGMLYGRVVRPPSRGATLLDVGTEPAMARPGVVAVVRDGSFLGVIAEREEVALRAADLLRAEAKWQEQPTLPDEDDLPAFLTSAPAETSVLAESAPPATPAARPDRPRARTKPPITGLTWRTRRWARPARRRWPEEVRPEMGKMGTVSGWRSGRTARACTCCVVSWPGR